MRHVHSLGEPIPERMNKKTLSGKVWIGTSGFQYQEWRGKFYPETLSLAKMLPYYGERFSSTEINYSFRRIPSEKTMDNWAALSPEDFRFSLKAPQKITHFAKLRDQAEAATYFLDVVQRLGLRLGTVLFQLPPSLPEDKALLRDFLAGLPPKARVAFEFRHDSWFDDTVFSILQDHGAALCVAESETLKTPAVATADFGYLRLRREDYSIKELNSWAEMVKSRAWKSAYVYFKHEKHAVGPGFAAEFQKLCR